MKYFSIEELCKSDTATKKKISNTPNAQIKSNITLLIDNVLDKLRESYGKPIRVTSGYRCQALNTAVGGSKTSQHMVGQAADITGGSPAENKKIFDIAVALKLPFDQCIDEYGYKWVHISYGPRNRRQILHLK